VRKFAEELKEIRTEKELSIHKLSKEVDISAGAICHWENGKNDIKSDQLISLAKFFDVSTDYLLGLEDY